MESETGKRSKSDEEMEQWGDSVSSCSSVSSVTSDSSDGHIILGNNIPRPSTNYVSAPEAQRKKESSSMSCSLVTSQPGLSSSSSSSHQNQLIGIPGYDPNRIPASVFSSKPSNPMEWSLASNDSLFSLHMSNFSFSGDPALAAVLRSGELPKLDEPLYHKTEPNPVPPSVKEFESLEKKPEAPENLNQEEESDSESDDEETEEEGEEVIKLDTAHHEAEILAETQKETEEEKEEEEEEEEEEEGDAMEIKPEDPTNVSHSTSISCRSDTSNNSNCSFAFPVLENEDGGVKTPSIQTEKEGSKKSGAREEFPQPRTQQQPQTHTLPQPQPQSNVEGQTQSQKATRFRWLSCFYFSLRCC